MKLVAGGEAGSRWCPLCGLVTDERSCPNDQVATLVRNAPTASLAIVKPGMVVAGRFRVEELLGRGGFAAVFRATQSTTGQPIAIKVLEALQIADNEQLMRRFFAEARATAGLRHPNTVRVFDFGQDDNGLLFIAMELLTGRTLKQELNQRLRQGTVFSETEAVEIGSAVTHSLAEAHHSGLVHRDLKPDNIFLHQVQGAEATIKVVDFGIVKLAGSNLTQQNNVSTLGTPTYMSPEQALGAQDVDARSDIYSLATVLYELVAGEAPFRSPNWQATLLRQISEAPRDLRSAAQTPVSDGFADTIHRALAKEPEDRFANVNDFRRALAASTAAADRPRPASGAPPVSPLEPAPTARAQRVDLQAPPTDPSAVPDSPSWMVPTAVPSNSPQGPAPNDGISVLLQPSTGAMPRINFTAAHAPIVAEPAVGVIVEGKYHLEEILFDGGTRSVFRGKRISDQLAVSVAFARTPERLDELFGIHQRARGPHVAAPLERFSSVLGPQRYECLVRQLIEGPTLGGIARTRPIEEREALELLSKVAGALAELEMLNPPVHHGGLSVEAVVVGPSGQVGLVAFATPNAGATGLQDFRGLGAIGVQLLGGNPSSAPETWREILHATPVTKNLLRMFATSAPIPFRDVRERIEHVRLALPRMGPSVRPAVLGAKAEPTLAPKPAPAPMSREQLEDLRSRNEKAQDSGNSVHFFIAGGVGLVAVAFAAYLGVGRGPAEVAAPASSAIVEATRGLVPTLNFCAAGASGIDVRVAYAVLRDGTLVAPSAVFERKGASEVVACVEDALDSWRYPKFESGFVVASLAISFLPSGAQINPERKSQLRHFGLTWSAMRTTEGYAVEPYAELLNSDTTAITACMADAARRLMIPKDAAYNASVRVRADGTLAAKVAGSQLSDANWAADPTLAGCVAAALTGRVGPKPDQPNMEVGLWLHLSQTSYSL
ncbi:MAG: protein kinase [Deltaproteobacteria bacterium]|nr:protein kinase [Deltaproteobacteria bacterium]